MELGITTGKVLGTYDNNAKVNRNILYIMQSILHNIIHRYLLFRFEKWLYKMQTLLDFRFQMQNTKIVI